jgi:hypothetical protein
VLALPDTLSAGICAGPKAPRCAPNISAAEAERLLFRDDDLAGDEF